MAVPCSPSAILALCCAQPQMQVQLLLQLADNSLAVLQQQLLLLPPDSGT
jgi:hypothetical protein